MGKKYIELEKALDAMYTCRDTESITFENGGEYIDFKQAVEELEQIEPVDIEIKYGDWTKCEKDMPKERFTIFAKFKNTDKWEDTMPEKMSDHVLVTVEFEDGTRMVRDALTVDGKWKIDLWMKKDYKVVSWMPHPAPDREK